MSRVLPKASDDVQPSDIALVVEGRNQAPGRSMERGKPLGTLAPNAQEMNQAVGLGRGRICCLGHRLAPLGVRPGPHWRGAGFPTHTAAAGWPRHHHRRSPFLRWTEACPMQSGAMLMHVLHQIRGWPADSAARSIRLDGRQPALFLRAQGNPGHRGNDAPVVPRRPLAQFTSLDAMRALFNEKWKRHSRRRPSRSGFRRGYRRRP